MTKWFINTINKHDSTIINNIDNNGQHVQILAKCLSHEELF